MNLFKKLLARSKVKIWWRKEMKEWRIELDPPGGSTSITKEDARMLFSTLKLLRFDNDSHRAIYVFEGELSVQK